MSASAPAGMARTKKGRFVAACTKATIKTEAESSVISHAAPTFCIHVPTLDAKNAIQSHLNKGRRKGAYADDGTASVDGEDFVDGGPLFVRPFPASSVSI